MSEKFESIEIDIDFNLETWDAIAKWALKKPAALNMWKGYMTDFRPQTCTDDIFEAIGRCVINDFFHEACETAIEKREQEE